MKFITSFDIEDSNLLETSSFRRFIITGEKDAQFMLQVVNSSQEFYNFNTKSFSGSFISQSNLNVKMRNNVHRGSILFPAKTSGDTYTVLLTTTAYDDTELSFTQGKNSSITTITQDPVTTLTFTVATSNTNNYTSWSSANNITSTGTTGVTITDSKTLNWTLINAENNTYGFGLRLTRQPIDIDWYVTKTGTVNQAVIGTTVTQETVVAGTEVVEFLPLLSDLPLEHGDYVFGTGLTLGSNVHGVDPSGGAFSVQPEHSGISSGVTLTLVRGTNEWVLDDVTDIATGMVITAVSGTNAYLNGTPTVTAVNESTNTITLSEVPVVSGNDTGKQGFVDGITLTLQARGSDAIEKAIGAKINFSNFNDDTQSAVSAELTNTIRSDASDNNLALTGTYGVSGGGFVTVSGAGINNTGVNTVQVVTPHATQGSILMQESQEAGIGTKIYLQGSAKEISINNNFTVESLPSADQIVYLNLDNFITPGVSGS